MVAYHFIFNTHTQQFSLSEWISSLTLCLAPLIVHIISGVTEPVYLSTTRPLWHDRIVHFNPTSIIWRYFAITDRRARAKLWTAYGMSASSALFWTDKGWDGVEHMIQDSVPFSVLQPSQSHTAFFSTSTLKSCTISLQGVQALYLLAGTISSGTVRDFYVPSVVSLFLPLAILGLLRLPAAFWLTEETSYRNCDELLDNAPQKPHGGFPTKHRQTTTSS